MTIQYRSVESSESTLEETYQASEFGTEKSSADPCPFKRDSYSYAPSFSQQL